MAGAVTKPAVIEEFEESIRDEFRTVQGDGASEQKTSDTYRWNFAEVIRLSPGYVRDQRYQGISEFAQQADAQFGREEVPEIPKSDATESTAGDEREKPQATAEQGDGESQGSHGGDVSEKSGGRSPATESASLAEGTPDAEGTPGIADSGKSESAQSDTETKPESEPDSEPETNSDSEIVAEIRPEVKS